jgi:membrane protease YdiL (CAAX protease family)
MSLLLICGSFLLNYLTSLFYSVLALDVPSAFSSSGYSSQILALVCVTILPALFEELFFRGAVLTMLRLSKIRTPAVIGFSSVLFMILHGPGWYFLTDLFAGMMLGLLVYITGSIYPAMIAHFVSNFVSYILAHFGSRLMDVGIGDLAIHTVIVCLIGALCHLLTLLRKLLIRREKEDRSRINENSRRWEEQKAKGE